MLYPLWDGTPPPLAWNLLQAMQGLCGSGAYRDEIVDSCVAWAAQSRAKPLGLQKMVCDAIIRVFPLSLDPLFTNRLTNLVHGFVPRGDVVQSFKVSLDGCQPHVRMACIKTILNTWTTSHRFHEEIRLPCIFGCSMVYAEGEPEVLPVGIHPLVDDLRHYLQCPTLWNIVGNAYSLPVGHSIEQRLGIKGPPFSPVALAIAFDIYHAIKIGNRYLISNATLSNNFLPVLRTAREVAAYSCSQCSPSLPHPFNNGYNLSASACIDVAPASIDNSG